MGTLIRPPFRAMQSWKKHVTEPPCLLARGMWAWFTGPPGQRVRVFSQDAHEGDRHYCDVQLEVLTPKGPRQVYIMTLITEILAREQDALAFEFGESPEDVDPGVVIEDLESPFEMPTVRWLALLCPKEVMLAVRAWCEKFWPDWDVNLVWGETPGMSRLWEGRPIDSIHDERLQTMTHCDVLLQVDARLLENVREWASAYGAFGVYVVAEALIAINGLPVVALRNLEASWPDIAFIAVPSI